MDLSGMPMQTDANGLQSPPATNGLPQNQQTNAFGQNVFTGVSELRPCVLDLVPDMDQADPATSNGEGYTLGFRMDMKSE